MNDLRHTHREGRRATRARDNAFFTHIGGDLIEHIRRDDETPLAHRLRSRQRDILQAVWIERPHRAVHRKIHTRVNDRGRNQSHHRHE